MALDRTYATLFLHYRPIRDQLDAIAASCHSLFLDRIYPIVFLYYQSTRETYPLAAAFSHYRLTINRIYAIMSSYCHTTRDYIHAAAYPYHRSTLDGIHAIVSSYHLSALRQAEKQAAVAAMLGRYLTATAGGTQQAWNGSSQSISEIRDLVLGCYETLRRSALWVVHLPRAVLWSIAQWISTIKRAIRSGAHAAMIAVMGFLKVLALGIVTVSTIAVLIYAMRKLIPPIWKLARQRQRDQREKHRQKEDERRQREWREGQERERTGRTNETHRLQKEEEERQEQRRQQAEESQQQVDAERKIYRQWQKRCEALLSCRNTMTGFPDPPFWPCTAGCRDNEILKACRHSIERLYRGSGSSLGEVLKQEKIRWHPDRFAKCPAPSREHIVAKATEMFKIVQVLLEDERISEPRK